jgi:hypothetical protein
MFALLCVLCAVVDHADPDLECTGVHIDGGAGADPRQVVRGEPLSEFANNDDEQIVQCLEHVRQCDLS